MFMNRMKAIQEILDMADPYFLEACVEKTDEALLEMKKTELRYKEIYISRNKSLTEVNQRIMLIDSLIEMRALKEALKDHDSLIDEGKAPVGGISVV